MNKEDIRIGKIYAAEIDGDLETFRVHSVTNHLANGTMEGGKAACFSIDLLSDTVDADMVDWRWNGKLSSQVGLRCSRLPQTFDLINFLEDQQQFSRQTFGPTYYRLEGVLDHILKEVEEVRAEPYDLNEWIDIIMLALDGAWRAGYHSREIVAALNHKLYINMNREWPDWRNQPEDQAIEHNKD